MGRATVWTLLAGLSASRGMTAPPVDDPALALGLRQVEEGDFEGAVATLGPVADRLADGPARAEACLQLGIAHLALDQRDQALSRFRQALERQPTLRLTPDRFSPKVIAAFEQARREYELARETQRKAGTAAPRRKLSRAWLLAGAGVAAGGAVALLATRGSDAVRFSGLRFSSPVIECPNGSVGVPLFVNLDFEATNDGQQSAQISNPVATLIMTAAPDAPGEVGKADSKPAVVMPTAFGHGTTTVHVRTSLTCSNGVGGPARYNEWQGRLAFVSASGSVSLQTPDRLRVEIP
jgi:hypothetical protein